MMDTLLKVWSLFTPAEKHKAIFMLLLVVIMAVLETIGVLSIMPFLSVIVRPEIISEKKWLLDIYNFLNFDEVRKFIVALGVMSIFVIVLSSISKTFIYHVINRFIHLERYSISTRLLSLYINQPYEFFLKRNGSELSKNVLSEVDMLIFNLIQPIGHLIAQSFVITAMLLLVFFYDPWIAMGTVAIIGGLYVGIYRLVRQRLALAGKEVVVADKERYQSCNEVFSGIRDIKISGASTVYEKRFAEATRSYARHVAASETLSQTPLYLVEAVGYTGLIVIALVLLVRSDDVGHVLPALGMYGFAAYRLLPAVQIIYRGVARLKFAGAALDNICKDLKIPLLLSVPTDKIMAPCLSIELKNVSYAYPSASEKEILKDFNLRIRVNTTVGITGVSGSGKSTLMDLLLGLQLPQKGLLLVDDVEITDGNMKQWQNAIGYVSQHIYIADATIAENIAFGVDARNIDMHAVERAARAAQIHELIVNELPRGYQTNLGERGIRLSGGQRQRIGIARALYRDPPVLFFDEATSALDESTENLLNIAISQLKGRKTIIVIAHKASALRSCEYTIDLN